MPEKTDLLLDTNVMNSCSDEGGFMFHGTFYRTTDLAINVNLY